MPTVTLLPEDYEIISGWSRLSIKRYTFVGITILTNG